MEDDEEEEKTQKLHKEEKKKKKQQEEDNNGNQRKRDQFSPPAKSPPQNRNPEMSSRSSLHSLPPTTVDSPPPDSPTVSSIPDSHGSSPHTIIPTPSVASVATKNETPFRITNEEQKLGESRRQLRPSFSTPRESKWASFVRKALLGFRVSAFVSCLVSFSVMVADRDKGWARDSFYNYKEFRFCLAANLIGFVYSAFMICDLLYLLSTSIRRSRHNLRHFLEFALDQMIAYLLASASTSASIRVDDWLSNWGADKFPDLARASVSLSFVSFVSFAFCSLASGYALCSLRSI
ncbi:hypothetical protein EUTSA_v10027871mg [Eutrema salsugineum]|uniref:CASP-like protein n=1 Tax=Eutrema salsugineum TaxID=72664 RepID=V4NKP2_EUTSA|nr:CASP-like protein 4A1 [Eutrema salsugineum]ESQ46966.1 hypothetical protein EUTSA_v10027871mg [Eutrema salsugineum]